METTVFQHLVLLLQLYPGNSTYGHQTGGRLQSLRDSTTNAAVRAYHKKFYRSENIYLTITGNIEPKLVFEAIAKVIIILFFMELEYKVE